MDTSKFITREVGPGLCSHSAQLANNIEFHIIAASQYSLEELLTTSLKREIMIEIFGLDARRWNIIADDPLFITARSSMAEQYVFLTISNKDLEEVFEKTFGLAAQ